MNFKWLKIIFKPLNNERGSIMGAITGGITGAMYGSTFGWVGAIVGFVIGAVIGGYLPVLLAPDVPNPPGCPLQPLQFTTNEIGLSIPELLGTGKMSGNLLGFGGERSEEVTQKVGGGKGGGGGSKKQVVGHKYYMSWAIGLCMGPVDEVLTIFRNEDVVWSGNVTRPVSGGKETIVIPDMGSVVFFFGTDDQDASGVVNIKEIAVDSIEFPLFWTTGTILIPRLVSGSTPIEYTLNHRGLCWAFFNDCYIGDYNRMPTMRFALRKTPAKAFSEYGTVQALDYNPAHAIRHILHDLAGLPEAWLDDTDFATMAQTLYLEGRGISLLMDSQNDAMSYIETINGHIDGIVRYGNDGKFHPKLIRDDYTVGDLPTIDESIVLEDPALSRKSWIDTINEVKVQYSEITLARPGETVWFIDGAAWPGAIRTVGVDKNFTTIQLAILDANAAEEACLYLIDAGTYGQISSWQHDIYLRGLGENPTDVIITAYGGQGISTGAGKLFIENIYTYFNWNAHQGPSMFLAPISIINKCVVGNADVAYGWGMPALQTGTGLISAYIQNTLLIYTPIGSPSHISSTAELSRSLISLDKVSHNGIAFIDANLVGTYAIDDKAVGGTAGYGPNYGAYRITQGPTIEGTGDDIKKSTADPAAIDVGNKEIQGRVVSRTIQTALFTTNANAVWAGSNALRKESYPFAFVSFPANRNAFRLEVGDCFKFSYSRYGITDMICRVLQIGEEGPESEIITVTAQEDIFSVASAITEYSAPISHKIPPTDYTIEPFTYQGIIEAPYVASPTIALLSYAARKSNLDLGYEVYMSVDGGSSYSYVATINKLNPYGTLVGSYPESAHTIDNDIGFTIDFAAGADEIETTTFVNALAGISNMAILGDEIVSFVAITPPESGTQYDISNIIRRRFDTQKQTHTEGTTFFVLTSLDVDMIANPEITTGAVRKFKFVPFNTKLKAAIADCAAIDITIEGRSLTPYMPINLEANGIWDNSRFSSANYDTDIVLTWDHRIRGKGAGIGIPGVVLADTDHEGYFKVEVYVSAALVRTTDALEVDTWTYTEAMNLLDNTSLAVEVVLKVSNYITTDGNTYESDQAEITVTLNV